MNKYYSKDQSQVAVLLCDNTVDDESRWYTSHHNEVLLFLPDIVEYLLSIEYLKDGKYTYCHGEYERQENIRAILVKHDLWDSLPSDCDLMGLTVHWVDVGLNFTVDSFVMSSLISPSRHEIIVPIPKTWITA